jgi:hypothetical protein
MATTDILVSDWLISKNSPLKSLSQMNRNLVGIKSANQKEESPLEAMFVNGSGWDDKFFIEDLP